ncbi:MAG: oligosaccharide flippase family protein [Hyphomicrobium sp.]
MTEIAPAIRREVEQTDVVLNPLAHPRGTFRLTRFNLTELWKRARAGRLLAAVGWSTAAHFGGQFIRIATSLVLTRLLAPEMFGVMSLVAAIQITITLLSDFGTHIAIVQHKRGDDPDFLNTAWTVSILRGFGQWAVCIVIAGVITALNHLGMISPTETWGYHELPLILAVTGFGSAILGFQSTNIHSASRHLNLAGQVQVDLASQLGSTCVAIFLAWMTGSIWALVANGLLAPTFNVLLSHVWIPGIRNRLCWDKQSVHDLVRSGRWIMLSSTMQVASSNGDRFLLAAMLSAATLGIYSLAINLVSIIDGAWSRVTTTVLLPKLSENVRKGADANLRSAVSKARLAMEVPLVAAAGFLFVTGPDIIKILYDDRYISGGEMVQILSFSLLLTRYNIFTTVYLALGRSDFSAIVSAIKMVSLLTLLPALYWAFGVNGALAAIAGHGAFSVPAILMLNRKFSLNNWSIELLTILGWPLGYVIGLLAHHVLTATGLT